MHGLIMYQYFRCCTLLPVRAIDRRFIGTLRGVKSMLNYLNNVGQYINTGIYGPTADEVLKNVDVKGKTCLITGANCGIGLEMTRCLTSHDCTVLMACRNTYAASVVAKSICGNNHRLRFYEINLASLRSVKRCSDDILKDVKKIDIVLLNAGTFGLPWTLTEDNLETTFQVNYLSQYYLLTNIEKILAPNARIVFVSSESHRNIKWSFSDKLMPTEQLVSLSENQYTSIKAYNVSKLCGILTMHHLGYRWLNDGKSVFCAHPGSFVKTRLCRNWWPFEALYTIMTPFSKTISQAASTPLYCATSPDLNNSTALYYKDCQSCDESELASDFHLSFRMNDLVRDILGSRVAALGEAAALAEPAPADTVKHTMDDSLVAGY